MEDKEKEIYTEPVFYVIYFDEVDIIATSEAYDPSGILDLPSDKWFN